MRAAKPLPRQRSRVQGRGSSGFWRDAQRFATESRFALGHMVPWCLGSGSSSSKQRICGYLGAPGIKKTGRPRPAVAFYTWRPGLSIAVQALVAIWTESS